MSWWQWALLGVGTFLAVYAVFVAWLLLAQLTTGWASVYVYDNAAFEKHVAFQRAARGARSARRGGWGACAGDFHRPA